ncbi:hypothetical protein JWG44_19160 [Leptospira sp. 201903071]|uniref:hypothetical protein n=1 Tax=Leptospira ainazelensis TaxID=2810034 RepID=UPI0019645AAA|nr:hypothetical protein [Leptospira ainazelensis]MBM9502375.1 hypothetical protein [Leptospira ainazelensis]
MNYLINEEKNSIRHIYTSSFDISLCKDRKLIKSGLNTVVEFEDLDELSEFFPNEIAGEKSICQKCIVMLNKP